MSYAYASFHAQTRTLLNARFRYEAARSFDLDDDLEFCPALLSEEELQSVHSGSDRSSLSSGSPNSSPLQHQIQPSSASSSYSFSSHSSFGGPINYHHHHHQQQKSQQSSQRIPTSSSHQLLPPMVVGAHVIILNLAFSSSFVLLGHRMKWL
ncbi:uncharacterized protein DFL_003307 [Arthrobotrys flagrans]|uniref:Uncharacterized protein n=1 Tax=Arthrobotrys flagrans TaxID=97331 RepID=A0A437A1G0_ARTFL|nr:hypothetical protein DFL_003307 [Arthrobotrys flagrans]